MTESISVGFDYRPSAVPGLRIRADYSDLEVQDRVASAGELQRLLPTEVYASLTQFFTYDDDGNLTRIDFAPINVSNSNSETVNADISYAFETAWGRFEPGMNIDYVIERTDQATADSDPVDNVGTSVGVDRYLAQARLGWENGPWSSFMTVHYTPGYDNVAPFVGTSGEREIITKIESRTTFDASIRRRFDSGLTVQVGARNLFDEAYSRGIFNARPYDQRRFDVRGRVAFVELNYDFGS